MFCRLSGLRQQTQCRSAAWQLGFVVLSDLPGGIGDSAQSLQAATCCECVCGSELPTCMPPSGAEVGAVTPHCDEGAIRDAANLGPGLVTMLQAFKLIHLWTMPAAHELDWWSMSETHVEGMKKDMR